MAKEEGKHMFSNEFVCLNRCTRFNTAVGRKTITSWSCPTNFVHTTVIYNSRVATGVNAQRFVRETVCIIINDRRRGEVSVTV